MIQISCPLAQFQMTFASLLQDAETPPSPPPPPPPLPFWLMYETAVVLSSFNNKCSLVLFLQKAFKKKKAACNSSEFMWHSFFIQFHLPPISVTCSVPSQTSKLSSGKIVRSTGGDLMGAKASKMFLIYYFNSFAASSET